MKKFVLAVLGCLALGMYQPTNAYTVTMNVSAYTHSSQPMANGEWPHVGAVAADDLPFGTRVIVNGRTYIVKDRFGGGYTNRLDIFMNSYDEAIQFGRQWLEVEVLL